MKKNSEKKLSLGKIKIASLSKPFQQGIRGGSTVPACNTATHPQSNYYGLCGFTKICVFK